MKTIYFKCTLLTDVVLNSSLATEGNLQSLDYIPGSNFLGIVAKELYKDTNKQTYDIFHSGKVSFGDALISENDIVSYAMPYSLFLDKLNNDITKDTVWVHHGINNFDEIKDNDGKKRQLKQHRSGYLNKKNQYISKVEKEFSLKSAYNREERRSDDGKMFGFEAIKKGQEFIFSVIFEDEQYIETITKALTGEKHIGKSKTAQYGLIEIEKIDKPEIFKSNSAKNNKLVIYAESNLCFFNENGQASFQPEAEDFGVKGKIIWKKSQIRTYTYSPWNAKRNTPDTQRDVILKGSVIVINLKENIDKDKLPKQVGEYNAEGLGRVTYNPEFLEFKQNGIWDFELKEIVENETKKEISIKDLNNVNLQTKLGKFLKEKALSGNIELEIGKKILEIFKEDKKNGKILLSSDITKSQWGNIRTIATQTKYMKELEYQLFDKDKGYLTHGVADEKIWGKKKGERRKALSRIIEENRNLGTQFVAKFAAEIAKKHKDNEQK